MTILIAENEVRSAELIQAILLSYLFSCILLNLSAFLISFLPIGGSIQKHNFLFYFYIILPWILPNLYPSFRLSLPRILSHIVTTLGYFGVLLHRLFLGIIILITFGYYHIDYFWVLPPTQYFANKHIRSKLFILKIWKIYM